MHKRTALCAPGDAAVPGELYSVFAGDYLFVFALVAGVATLLLGIQLLVSAFSSSR